MRYLEAALDTVEAHHIYGADYDWRALRHTTLERAEGAEEPADTYEAIRLALADIGDRHGSFQPPRANGGSGPSASPAPDRQAPALPEQSFPELTMRERVAHLKVPFFMGQDEERVTAYASQLQAHIRTANASDACGWIVDLRGNGGGNMWPMIAGLGPLLGEGEIGAISGASDEPARWIYEAGRARLDTMVLAQVDGAPVVMASARPPVAVLTDEPAAREKPLPSLSAGATTHVVSGRLREEHPRSPDFLRSVMGRFSRSPSGGWWIVQEAPTTPRSSRMSVQTNRLRRPSVG